MKLIRKQILLWLMGTNLYSYLLKNVIPYIRFSLYYTSLRGNKYHGGYHLLQAGDIIVTKDSKKLTSYLIGGEWSHAAFCVSSSPYDKSGQIVPEIIEFTHTDFTRSWFFDLCKESDRYMILRCKDFDPEYVQKMIERVWTFKDAKYDQRFRFDIEALYCSELIYQADFEKRLKVSIEDLAGLGQEYISPVGLAKALNCEVIFDSDRAA